MSEKKKHPGGRPPFFKTPEELENKIHEYFNGGCDKRTVVLKDGSHIDIPTPTITGLCLFLGFADKCSFYDYEKRSEFSYSIKRARTFIEKEYEQMLHSGNATGAIFALKNFGWQDRTEIDHTTKGEAISGIIRTVVDAAGN